MSLLPDYLTDMNAVLKDNSKWINGKAPDYSFVNKVYFASKTSNHSLGSLEDIVNNLVKNWEKEASFKTDPEEWRTIDNSIYKFSSNGGKWLTSHELVKVGTYNALIGDSEYYKSSSLNAEQSHQVIRKCLPQGFAWECLEVYSPPPRVAFKWRHWGQMSGPLECPMRNGQQLVAQPSGQLIEIFGVTIAEVTDQFKITKLETFFNPNDMFEQMLKNEVPSK